jgi:hypothetical protein
MLIASTFVSNTAFTVAGDRTGAFAVGVRVQADCGTDGTLYGTVTASSYASDTDLTTVTLSLDSENLTANLTGVLHGNDVPPSLVNHGHGNQADGGELPDFIRRDNSRTFSQGFISGEGAYTGFKFTETGADVASNAGKWIFQVDDGMFSMLAVDDAESAFNAALTINRTGANPSAVTIAAPYIGLDADNVEASGNIVPPASDPGSLGTASRPWADVRTGKLLGMDVSGGTVDALVSKASAAEAVTGTDTAKAVTPAAVRQAVLSLVRDSLGKFPGVTPPSLNLFCGNATSDTAPVGTFTRSTTGTRLGQTGLIETVAAGNVRREWDACGNPLGWLIEGSRTNAVLSSRDLTNAIWTKTNCTAALSQTGIDGAAASASLLTATADAATCLQSITLASSNRFQTAYLKRIAGSGAVSMTTDGGATWTDITASLSTTAWTRVSIPVQTLANPSVGFRLATSGNAIAVDGVQNETGSYSTSNIATTSAAVARSADVWTMPLNTSWFNTTAGTLFVSGRTAPGTPPSGVGQVLAQFDDGSTANRIYMYRDLSMSLYARVVGTAVSILTLGTVADLTTFRAAFSWSSSGFSASLNGGACVTAAATALPSGLTTHRIGSDAAGGSQWGGHMLHDAYFPYALSDADKMAITL